MKKKFITKQNITTIALGIIACGLITFNSIKTEEININEVANQLNQTNEKIDYKEAIKKTLSKMPTSAKFELARNEKLSQEVLEVLSEDKNIWVVAAIASNKTTNPYILASLINHPNDLIRNNLVKNENLSNDLLLVLTKDKNEFISKVAKAKLLEKEGN